MKNTIKIKLSQDTEKLYKEIMDEISTDIWDVIDNFHYYKKIRGIWDEYIKYHELSKRQLVRLYCFIYELDDNGERVFTKKDIHDMFNDIKTDHKFGEIIENE